MALTIAAGGFAGTAALATPAHAAGPVAVRAYKTHEQCTKAGNLYLNTTWWCQWDSPGWMLYIWA
ncbi:hypothetical protein [Actinoallomurus acanthiterrae]